LRLAPQYAGRVQAGDPELKPDERGRLRDRALARWLIAAGPSRPQPGSQPMSAELVVRDGRACAAVTAADGQVLAIYPVSGSGERRRRYEAVPVTARRAPAPSARADLAALRAFARVACGFVSPGRTFAGLVCGIGAAVRALAGAARVFIGPDRPEGGLIRPGGTPGER